MYCSQTNHLTQRDLEMTELKLQISSHYVLRQDLEDENYDRQYEYTEGNTESCFAKKPKTQDKGLFNYCDSMKGM